MDKTKLLEHYSKKDIQQELVRLAKNKEVAGSYNGEGYGKRPGTFEYQNDVIEDVKSGMTSFHMSVETWSNPILLNTDMKKQDIEKLRIGWDLIIDIDSQDWNLSKIITNAIIQRLKLEGVKSITCKFSGNKGFHIAVPFEAFPKTFQNKETRNMFPDACRRIAEYLVAQISKDEKFIKQLNIDKNKEIYQKFVKLFCVHCNKQIKIIKQETFEYNCDNPGCLEKTKLKEEKSYINCPKCKSITKMSEPPLQRCQHCEKPLKTKEEIDMKDLMSVDTILISTRHLFRMPYSMHEKSGLVSIPINIDKTLEFDKTEAVQEKVTIEHRFLDRNTVENEASNLLINAYEYAPKIEQEFQSLNQKKEYEEIKQALPRELFPPCIILSLKGVEDGKKRILFILTNFLKSVGWSDSEIKTEINAWNKLNPDQLREAYIQGQLSHGQRQKENILPPNCNNQMYYQSLQICKPDSLCKRIKNPTQYAKRRAFLININKNKPNKASSSKSP